jgi:hypothetical protein
MSGSRRGPRFAGRDEEARREGRAGRGEARHRPARRPGNQEPRCGQRRRQLEMNASSGTEGRQLRRVPITTARALGKTDPAFGGVTPLAARFAARNFAAAAGGRNPRRAGPSVGAVPAAGDQKGERDEERKQRRSEPLVNRFSHQDWDRENTGNPADPPDYRPWTADMQASSGNQPVAWSATGHGMTNNNEGGLSASLVVTFGTCLACDQLPAVGAVPVTGLAVISRPSRVRK